MKVDYRSKLLISFLVLLGATFQRCSSTAAAAPLGAGETSGRALRGVHVLPNSTQTSHNLEPDVDPVVHDIPLNHPLVARKAQGWEPEGVHLTLWARDAVLVSWQTGEPRTGPTANPPPPHDAAAVKGHVVWGSAPGQYSHTAGSGVDTVYSYAYDERAGGMTYRSPILHHVLLTGLKPGQTYFYRVGGSLRDGTLATRSREFAFRMPAAAPAQLRIGVIGDPGQTFNTSAALHQLAASKPDVVFVVGDLSYADLYYSNQTDTRWSFANPTSSQQLRWDSFARLTEPLLSSVPGVFVGGNHEVERLELAGGATFTAYNARYPGPQDPASIVVAPNNASHYLNASNPKQFVNTSGYQPLNAYYSVELPWAKVVALNNYLPYNPGSPQYRWAAAELARTDRRATPWLLVVLHGAPRTSYATQLGPVWLELEEFMSYYEPLFRAAQVDLVLSGHVHSYERTLPLLNFTVNPCGPAYLIVGDGGNVEGPECHFIDAVPPPYCANQSLYVQPAYQPTTTGRPHFGGRTRPFCPTRQPEWSAFRDPSFGHALLTIINGNTAEWAWMRGQDSAGTAADKVTLQRAQGCELEVSQAAESGSGAVSGRLNALAMSTVVDIAALAVE